MWHLTSRLNRKLLAHTVILSVFGLIVTPLSHFNLSNSFLNKLHTAYCNKMGVSVAVSLPWLYTNQEFAEINQSLNQQLVTEISDIVPVLKDGHLGGSTAENMFADTTSHLSKLGAKLKTSIIGHALRRLN